MGTTLLFNIAFIALTLIATLETITLIYILLHFRLTKKAVKKIEVKNNGIN
jgi:hypothetical protein